LKKSKQPEAQTSEVPIAVRGSKVIAFKIDGPLLVRLEDSARIADRTVSAEIRVLLRKAYGLEVEDARAAI